MKQKNLIIAAVAVLMIIGLVSYIVAGRTSKKTTDAPAVEMDNEVLPTVDASVKVDLEGRNNNRAIALTISGIPKGTESIEYSLSYQTKGQGLQGIIGTIEAGDDTEKTVTRELGTCSSGTCVYHDVEGKIKVELKFSGAYGEKIFDKEFEL